MARFDIYKYDSASVPLVLDVQANLLSDLRTRVVVPLVREAKAKKERLPKLKPVIKVKGRSYVVMTTDIAAVRTKDLGATVGNVEDTYREVITTALDLLYQGF
jgi:toxin CcdB